MMRNRKSMTFGTTVVAVLLAMASVAFACTTFKGRFEVTANGGTSKAWGKNLGMVHCTSPYEPVSAAKVDDGGGTITVEMFSTGTNETACPDSELDESSTSRTYNIYYVKDGFSDQNGVWVWDSDCMAGSAGVQLATADSGESDEIWIKASGRSTTGGSSDPAGSRTYTIPVTSVNLSGERAGVCISDTGAGQGNQTPVKIVQL